MVLAMQVPPKGLKRITYTYTHTRAHAEQAEAYRAVERGEISAFSYGCFYSNRFSLLPPQPLPKNHPFLQHEYRAGIFLFIIFLTDSV